MAKDDLTRRRRREERNERDRAEATITPKGRPGSLGALKKPGSETTGAIPPRIEQLLDQVEPLIQQLHQLYNMFQAGVEKRPPVERRKQLDQLMATLTSSQKPSAVTRFRFTAVQASYLSHVELWERMLKKMERG
jgi:hypothetical protein